MLPDGRSRPAALTLALQADGLEIGRTASPSIGGKMRYYRPSGAAFSVALLTAGLALLPKEAAAHCDSMGGPVVHAAQKALETNTIEIALAWVLPAGEREIRDAFDRTMRVRAAGGEARELADLWFFETLVRVHRTGEGEPYTGLKPAGSETAPGIVQADRALEVGSVAELAAHLSDATSRVLRERFGQVVELRNYSAQDVSAGRLYVRAYTEYMHFVEALFSLLTGEAEAHSGAHDAVGRPPQ